MPSVPRSNVQQAANAQCVDNDNAMYVAPSAISIDELWQYWDQATMTMRLLTELLDAITDHSSRSIALGQWLIDSGCSNHYTASNHILDDFHLITRVTILTGNGHIQAQGMGNVTLHSSLGTRKLTDVMWIPDLAGANHLLSIPQLIRKGCTIRMFDNICEILDKKSHMCFLMPGLF